MQYEPIKDKVHQYISLFPILRKGFFKVFDLLLLRQRYVKREIMELGAEGMSFYDAGAGFCQYSDYVLSKFRGSKVFAVDIKVDYLRAYAFSQPQRFRFQRADLQVFSPGNSYDLAIAIDILEHIEDDMAAIKNLHKALKIGGHLIISTPSDLDEAARFTAEHVRPGYDLNELCQKLSAAGFSVKKAIYSYGFWGAISWKLLIKYPLFWQAKSKFYLMLLPLWFLVAYPAAALMMHLDMARINKTGNGIIVVCKKD